MFRYVSHVFHVLVTRSKRQTQLESVSYSIKVMSTYSRIDPGTHVDLGTVLTESIHRRFHTSCSLRSMR